MSRKTNPLGLRLGIRTVWLYEGSLSSYSEQTRQFLFIRRLVESMLKRLRMQSIGHYIQTSGHLITVKVNFAKRRIKRRGSRLTIRRRRRLRWRRWGRRGARVVDKIRPYVRRRRKSYFARKRNKKFWSKIPSPQLRSYWRYAVGGRLRRIKRRVFWKHIQIYLHRFMRQRLGMRIVFNLSLIRSPLISTLRKMYLIRLRTRVTKRVAYTRYMKSIRRLTQELYFPKRFKKLVDDPKRIKWSKRVLRNVPRYVLSIFIAIWMPSANVLCALLCHALRANRRHWVVMKFFNKLISRLWPANMCVRGIKIRIAGKFNRRLRSANMVFKHGLEVPLNTYDTHINYSFREAYTYLGVFGVRVWFYVAV